MPNTRSLKKRAGPIERVMARVCREKKGRGQIQRLPEKDECLGPCFRRMANRNAGPRLAIDVTLRDALGTSGNTQPLAAVIDCVIDRVVLTQARVDKNSKSPLWLLNCSFRVDGT